MLSFEFYYPVINDKVPMEGKPPKMVCEGQRN
jgi:hypothetical protein